MVEKPDGSSAHQQVGGFAGAGKATNAFFCSGAIDKKWKAEEGEEDAGIERGLKERHD